MNDALKETLAELRLVYEPPAVRAWSKMDVKLAKLAKQIDELPADAEFLKRFRAELSDEKDKAKEHFDIADAVAAYERARRPR